MAAIKPTATTNNIVFIVRILRIFELLCVDYPESTPGKFPCLEFPPYNGRASGNNYREGNPNKEIFSGGLFHLSEG